MYSLIDSFCFVVYNFTCLGVGAAIFILIGMGVWRRDRKNGINIDPEELTEQFNNLIKRSCWIWIIYVSVFLTLLLANMGATFVINVHPDWRIFIHIFLIIISVSSLIYFPVLLVIDWLRLGVKFIVCSCDQYVENYAPLEHYCKSKVPKGRKRKTGDQEL